MYSLQQWFSAYWADYRLLVEHHRNSPITLPINCMYQLNRIAAAMLVCAVTGYVVQGYHFAFIPLNGLTPYLPELLLQNITMFGDGVFLLALMLAITTKNVQLHWSILVASILGAILSSVLKSYFDAPRPPAVLETEVIHIIGKAYKSRSFPSGHTLTAFLLASIVYCYFQSRLIQTLALALAAAVGLSRVFIGVHWPIDVLVGGAIGLICGNLAVYATLKWRSGVNAKTHKTILVLMLLPSIALIVNKGDYPLALVMVNLVAIIAIIRFLWTYLIPSEETAYSMMSGTKLYQFTSAIKTNPWVGFIVFISLVTLYRILVLTQGHFDVFYDEAYYYHWSLNPDLGYYSKPPMVAWVLSIGTFLFGTSAFAIKFISPILYAGSSLCIYAILRSFVSSSSAIVGGIVFSSSLLVGFNSEFITTDAPMLFFWSLSLLLFFHAIAKNHIGLWLLLGVTTGCGMLSKYTMGALPLALFLFLCVSARYRPLLTSPGPWAAAVLAGLIFGLNIYWNYQYDFIALQHTKEISKTDGQLFNFASLFEFLAIQLVIFGPISSYYLIKFLWNKMDLSNAQSKQRLPKAIELPEFIRCIAFATFVILIAISVQAFLSRAFANWAGPWIIGGSILVGIAIDQLRHEVSFKTIRAGIILQLLFLSIFYHWPVIQEQLNIEPSKKNTPFNRVAGWETLGQQLKPIVAKYPDALLLSDSRDLIAYLGFYAMPDQFKFARWNANAQNVRDYYDLKVNLREWQGVNSQSFIFVSKNELSEEYLSSFNTAEYIGELNAKPMKDVEREVFIYYVTGFKGYPANDK
ncbi:glycosyltransferase family 39 protein [Teredinibacter sp. KSP-S5-2]|uniref:glycosyltransferase family 39 protein n=1 Tax=Teredinibacter sp. KSP-S5-2 TaxID=3034506 RepID=UPI00293453B0|nr:glycosyltransferase family 39 protein [Teredinibacter sp. KSP-S5-2]WNO11205.1 glycosyltransferase family 39 protein [Teredinibacter sp. KSP-S5-2]